MDASFLFCTILSTVQDNLMFVSITKHFIMKKIFTLIALTFCLQGLHAQNALNFPDADDYGTVPYDPLFEFTDHFTIEAWVKVSGTGDQTVISTDSIASFGRFGYWFGITSSGTAGMRIFNGTMSYSTITGTTNINDDNWHHIAAAYAGNDVYVVVDGVQEGSGTYFDPAYNGNALDVGVDQEGNYISGTIDEVRLWHRGVPPAEINANKDSCFTVVPDSLIIYYQFDETAGSTFADSGPYSINGTLTNMTDNDWVSGISCNTSSLGELTAEGVFAYPNPTEGEVTIDLGELNNVSIHIYSMDGQLVYSEEGINTNEHSFELNEKAGVYQIVVSTDSVKKHLKLVQL